jgi:hypothetical protein
MSYPFFDSDKYLDQILNITFPAVRHITQRAKFRSDLSSQVCVKSLPALPCHSARQAAKVKILFHNDNSKICPAANSLANVISYQASEYIYNQQLNLLHLPARFRNIIFGFL